MSESVKQFEVMIAEEDHAEALRINEIFDEKIAATGHDEALAAAIDEAETELTEDENVKLPGKEVFGYAVAKNARRWWNYQTAYLRDLELTGGNEEVPKERVAFFGQKKNYAGDQLIKLDPVYFKTFDLLEKERVRLHLNTRPDVDPFTMARNYAALVLSSALDVTFEELARDDPQSTDGVLSYHSQFGQATYFTERTPDTRAKSYIINEYPDSEVSLDYHEPQSVYIIDGPRDPLGQPLVMEPQNSRPIVEACKILDLVNAATNYDEFFEGAAFKRVEEILAARREAEASSQG